MYIYIYIYIYVNSMKKIHKELCPPILSWLFSTWYQSLGFEFENFLEEISASRAVGGVTFETPTWRERGVSPLA